MAASSDALQTTISRQITDPFVNQTSEIEALGYMAAVKLLTGDKKLCPDNLHEYIECEILKGVYRAAMEHSGNVQRTAAVLLGINRGTLRSKLKKVEFEL
jgi:DNA-binding protein Fis